MNVYPAGWVRIPSEKAVREFRTVLSTFKALQRSDIDAQGYSMPDGMWEDLQDRPMTTFLRMSERGQQAVVFAIMAKLPEHST